MDIIDQIKQRFSDTFIESHAQCGDETVLLKKEGIFSVLSFLKQEIDLDFNMLMDLTAVDYLGRPGSRFEVVYHLYSLRFNRRLRVKALVSEEDCELDSAACLWPAANWYEREVWDMFGIRFKGHPNLKRILMYEEFKGHALRKDYPVNKRQPLVGPVN
jgi:NADH-quinone oxidoreductase subunit C